jgi:TRAP-type C4-dicarboxylate transport system permease small subunit
MSKPTSTWAQRRIADLALFMSRVAGWGYVACAVMITFDIVARNVFGVSSKATVELSGYALAFGISWGLAGAFVARMHVRVDMLLDKLPEGPRAWLHLMSLLLLIGFLTLVGYGILHLVRDSWELDAHDLSALQVPLWLPQGVFAIGIVVLFITVLVTLIAVVRYLMRADTEAVNVLMKQKSASEEAEEAVQASHGASPASPAVEGVAC